MDLLPEELIIKVISLISAKDVVRFSQLNRRFREIIQDNRKHLSFPRLLLTLSRDIKNYKERKILLTLTRGTTILIHCSDLNSISFSTRGNAFNEKFFTPFFERKHDPRSILKSIFGGRKERYTFQSLVDYIFEKADINLQVNYIVCPKLTRILIETVKNLRYKILDVQACFVNIEYDDLLSIGPNSYFKMAEVVTYSLPIVTEVKQWNEVASMFHSIIVSTSDKSNVYTIPWQWKELNFPEFSLNLRISMSVQSYMPLEYFPYIQENFHVESLQEYSKPAEQGVKCTCRLIDKKTGYTMTFIQKKAKIRNIMSIPPISNVFEFCISTHRE